MGAVVTKAMEDFAEAPKTLAEARLAVAAHAVLQWDCSPDAGTRTGIWDAEATCTNRDLLVAVDEILHLKEIHAFPTASPARRRMDSALGVAVSRLMDEFIRLRVWDAPQLQGVSGLRVAVERLSVSLAPSGGVWLAFPAGGSTSTGELSRSTTGELHKSGGSLSSRPDMLTVVADGTFSEDSDELDLICPASLSVLHEIALRVIRAGYTKELLHAFTKAPCHVLDRFLSMLQVKCSLEGDRISFEDAEWWTMEVMVKRWVLATKLVGKALVVMQRQLKGLSCGAFDMFKDDYFLAIAKKKVFVLLRFADGFTSTRSPEKLIYVLELYEALSDSAPGLLVSFTGQHMELISRQVAVVLAKLARALRVATGSLIIKIQTDSSQAPAESAMSLDAGVHPLARYAMTCVELLASHRTALDLILASGDEDERGAPAGGGAGRVSSFVDLVSELIAGLERNLEEKIAPACAAAGGSSRHLFLANNTSFVLNRAADAGVASLLRDEWAARRRGRLERHTASYAEASWGPVVACLTGGKPAKALAKFNAAFKRAHGSQVCREVPDPGLREDMRKAVLEMVVPAYGAFLQKHPRLGKSVRYTADNLAESLSELFEGGAGDGRQS